MSSQRASCSAARSPLPSDRNRTGVVCDPEQLLALYADLVYNLAVRLTGDREEARDLSQDAFIRIIKGAGSFRGEASLKTWVCQVVINCHRNRLRWWRRLKRVRTVSLDAPVAGTQEDTTVTLAALVEDPRATPDRQAEGRQARERLEAELIKLPVEQRTAILLREVEGMSYTEIAGALGVKVGTVKSRLARARDTLRLALSDLVGGGFRT